MPEIESMDPPQQQTSEGGGNISADQVKALVVLINAVHHAQTKGAFTLPHAREVATAVDQFVKQDNGTAAPDNRSSTLTI